MNSFPKHVGSIYQLNCNFCSDTYYDYSIGDFVKLIYDDGTDSPQFRFLTGNRMSLYIHMSNVDLVSPFYWIKLKYD